MAEGWAVVLGASEGTGAAIATAAARDPGLDVFGVHRGKHAASAARVEEAVREAGRRVLWQVGDASTPEAAAQGAEALASTGAPVRLFVHSLASASLGRFTGANPLSATQVRRTFDVMAHSFAWWAQALDQRGLLVPGSRLLALTNPLDSSLIRDCGLIRATKGALEGYVQALAMELGPRGIRVNTLKFSTVITPAVKRVYGEDQLAAVEEVHRRILPNVELCTVEEVAKVVSFLAGPDSAYFNGATIDFSGGMALGLADALLGRGA